MMKSNILLAAVLVGLLSGCGKDKDTSVDEVTANLSLSSVSIAGTALTSGSIGMFVGSDNGYTARSNVKYTFGNPWSSDSPVVLGTNAPSMCAYYPYSSSLTDATAVSLTSRQYSADADFCYASAGTGLSATSNTLALNLSHAYAQMTLIIARDASYSGTCAVSAVSLSNAGLNASATLNLFTGVYQSFAGVVAFDPQITGIESGSSATVVALLVPVTTAMSGNLVIALTVDGTKLTTSVNVTSSGLSTLAAGTNYQGTLSVQPVSSSVSSVSVRGWTVNEIETELLLDSPEQ
ncbi:MAG: hypothetical protein H6Q13_1204 [Bacteroidetes bacterium]|jgi:hypothetical protein|nr:hypothetical protein [Bacteroidota bacterium]